MKTVKISAKQAHPRIVITEKIDYQLHQQGTAIGMLRFTGLIFGFNKGWQEPFVAAKSFRGWHNILGWHWRL